MPLSAEHLRWVRERLCAEADSRELDRPYAFTHDLNASRTVEAGMVDDSLNWEVRFKDAAGESLTPEAHPVHRAVSDAAGMWGSVAVGRVATNKMFLLKPRYHRRGFATAVYASEGALYRRWNIREIQMLAVDAGLEVWPGEGFIPKEPEALRFSFRTWLRQQNLAPREPPATFVDYPPEFLRSRGYLQLYKVP